MENSNVVLLCTVQTMAEILFPVEESLEVFVALTLFDRVTVKIVPPPLTWDVAVQFENP